jgi:Cu(I)/Ag(I) efflux system protein CusF
MKVALLAAAVALALQTAPVFAQAGAAKDPHAGHNMAPDIQMQTKTYKASGVVKKIDAAKGSVTLAHGPVPELKWPAMTMGFTVKDKALLDKLAVDKTIDFEFVEQGKGYVVTAVK